MNQQLNQELREQQEIAFQESLEQDREKERKRQEAIEAERREAIEAAEAEKRQRRMREILNRRKLDFKKELESRSPVLTGIRVSIRFPDATRLETRFSIDESFEVYII